MAPIQIFISSVQTEFAPEREALRNYLNSDELMRRFFRVFLFEKSSASNRTPEKLYLDEVERSDIYLGLFGFQYESEDESGVSPTEREFDYATDLGLHRLVFIKSKSSSATRHGKMDALIKKAQTGLIRKQFHTQEELLSGLKVALIEYLDFKGLMRLEAFDKMPCLNAGMEDLDVDWMNRFVRIARRARNFPLDEDVSPTNLLKHLELFNEDKLTNAAILLFGKAPQKFFISSKIKCANFYGVKVEKPILSNQMYNGTVFRLVDQAVEYVLNRIDMRIGTRSESAVAPRTFEIPIEVVTEAIVNAVVHRDYASNASVQVMLFADRLEVWNPGRLSPKLTLAELRVPHESHPGNPLLAQSMYLAQLIEQLGTGTLDMIRRCVEAGLPEPEFEIADGFVTRIWRAERPNGLKVVVEDGSSRGQAGVKQKAKPGPSKRGSEYISLKIKEKDGNPAWPKPGPSLGQVALTNNMISMLKTCSVRDVAQSGLLKVTDYSSRSGGFRRQLEGLLNLGLLKLTIPDKPTSPSQKYRITEEGKAVLDQLGKLEEQSE